MQRRSLYTLVASALVTMTALPALAADYTIDPTHSFIEFKTKHFGFSWLSGRFNTLEGSMTFDPEAGPEAQAINITIEAESLDTNHEKRDEHLKGPDFFNADEFPTITFNSTGYDGGAEGGMLSGELTLLGVTKEVAFEVKKIGEGEDPWGGYRAGFEGQYTLARSDFGMSYDLGPAAEQVELDLWIEAIKN